MYCVKCGVELADSEKKCPLCQTTVVCPDGMKRENSESRYPPFPGNETEGISRAGALFIVTFLFFIPFALCLLCDLALNHEIVWSGYASGGILLSYILMILQMIALIVPIFFTEHQLKIHFDKDGNRIK